MRRKLTTLTLAICLAGALITGCAGTSTKEVKTNEQSSKDWQKVNKAFDKLKKMNSLYEISNVLQAPNGTFCYLEVCNKGASYTEYSVDKDGNYGTIAFQDSNKTKFTLADWVTSNNKGYSISKDGNWLSFPDSYSSILADRKYLYFNRIKADLTNLKFKEKTSIDIGMGEENMEIYTASLPAEDMRELVGMGTEQLYKGVKSEASDKNIKKLCKFYLEDIDSTMAFTDAKVNIGISDNMLRYLQFEVGGLGTRLYLTKAVLLKSVNQRTEPDFSSAMTYESSLKETADFVSKYKTAEEAFTALNNRNSENTIDATPSPSPSASAKLK